jgi:type I restriction enzyme S subunit
MSSGISTKPEQAGHGASFCSFTTVFNNYFLPPELPDRMNTSVEEQETYSLKEGDVLLTRTSETLDELGMSSVAVKNYPKATFSGFLKRLRPTQTDVVYHKFLAFYLRSPLFRKAMNNNAVMTLRCSLNEQIFSYLDLLLPDFDQQKKIGDLLFQIYAKIELNNRNNAELEGMAKLLYDYWFVQFDFPMTAAQAAALGKPHLTGHPYRASGGKMIYNETLKRDIPEGWTVKPLFDAMAVQYGFPFSTKKFTTEITDVPVIRIRDILENSISLYTTEQVDERYRLEPHDLVIGMDGNFHMNFWDKDGSYLNQRSVRIRARDDSSISTFQAYFELSPYIKAREKNVSRTTVGHLSDKDLKRLHLLQIKGSKEFDPRKTFDSLLSKIIHSRVENQELTQLRDWLLPMLMNGQVTVGTNER